jgi:hypothetical protein
MKLSWKTPFSVQKFKVQSPGASHSYSLCVQFESVITENRKVNSLSEFFTFRANFDDCWPKYLTKFAQIC